jgi:hypothetical protein
MIKNWTIVLLATASAFGPCSGIVQNMLIQSGSDPAKDEPGLIRIFPALPSAWEDVEVHDLRAEGAFLVSAKRSAGKTEWVRIKSLGGESCRVRPDIKGRMRVKGNQQFKLAPVSPATNQIDLKQGEEVLLCPATESSSQPVQPSSPPSRRNQ